VLARLLNVIRPHSHDPGVSVDSALETSARGLRALWISLVALGVTAALQAVVVAFTDSVALLSDTLHNAGDALTAVPLALAFWIGRWPPNRRYTYGYGRAEDLAGVVIVLVIAASAVFAAYESTRRLLDQAEVRHLWAVALAGIIGFCGNELVARYRVAVGREIGSAALVADGHHARTDGLTSLAVVSSAGGVALGWRWADPVVGLAITLAILLVLRSAVRDIYRRLMDAVDPRLVSRVEETLQATPGVLDVGEVRLRWIGHQLRAECEVVVNGSKSVAQGHAVALDAEHRLLHDVPRLTAATVHADPGGDDGHDHHELTAHHRETEA
jgi:cation diffusion facilitator family transporter